DRVGTVLAGVEGTPGFRQARIVSTAAERAGPMSGREGRRLVEEEKLGEPARLEQRAAPPAAELEPARDPALAVEAPADPSVLVVEAAAVTVDEPAARVCDELAERCDAV